MQAFLTAFPGKAWRLVGSWRSDDVVAISLSYNPRHPTSPSYMHRSQRLSSRVVKYVTCGPSIPIYVYLYGFAYMSSEYT